MLLFAEGFRANLLVEFISAEGSTPSVVVSNSNVHPKLNQSCVLLEPLKVVVYQSNIIFLQVLSKRRCFYLIVILM